MSIIQCTKVGSISFNLINRVKYQLCQSQKWQYHLCGDEKCALRQDTANLGLVRRLLVVKENILLQLSLYYNNQN